MLFNTVQHNSTLNIWLAYGVRASGKIRADRYNFSKNGTWDYKHSETICNKFEEITGMKVATYDINHSKSNRKPRNLVRHVYYSGSTPIPLRFQPISSNIDFLKE